MPKQPHQDALNRAAQLKGKTGLRRLLNATKYSWQGIRSAWLHEAAFREECLLALVLIPTAVGLPVSLLERAMLINSILFLLFAEILNSAIEATVDRMGEEIHPLAGRAKDMASAGVFFALLIVIVTWITIAGPILCTGLSAP